MTWAVLVLAATSAVPVFKGFEAARYQAHDALISKCVAEFNRHRGAWADANRAQARTIPDITEELVKAHMIQESGGGDKRSVAAWKVDPLQINVPGDWNEAKRLLGLRKAVRRNEGTTEANVRAAIKYLVRKGFSRSGKPVRQVEAVEFVDWGTALERYNGRLDLTARNKMYCVEYADRIIRRAENHDEYVGIEIKRK